MALPARPIFQFETTTFMDYIANLEPFFMKVYNLLDVGNLSLFEMIKALKKNGISQCDPAMLSKIIEDKLYAALGEVNCPECAAKAHVNKRRNVHVTTTLGKLSFAASYYSCPKCGLCFDPGAAMLGLRAGPLQYDVQKVAAKIASTAPFAETAEILGDLYGIDISPDAVHALTSELADFSHVREFAPDPDAIREIVDEITYGKKRRPVLVVAADGAMAPVRTAEKGEPHCWKENKGLRIYLVDDERIVHVFSWHQICSKTEFTDALRSIADLDLFPEDKVRICCLGDGAPWIWEAMTAVFPGARQVLDYYHCAKHLHDFVKVRFSVASEGASWLKLTKKRLFSNQGRHVIAGLKRMKLTGEAAKERDRLCTYLSNNLSRIDYRKIRKGGYPLGSGAIESANKFIGHVRLKRSGAWWTVDSANNILRLRCARYNSRFDGYFDAYEREKRPSLKPPKPRLALVK